MARLTTTERQAVSRSLPPRMVPVDQFYMYSAGCDADYIYGLVNGASKNLYRRDANKVFAATGLDLQTAKDSGGTTLGTISLYGIKDVGNNVILITLKDTVSSRCWIYKSIDRGATMGQNSPTFDDLKPVLNVGDATFTACDTLQNQTVVNYTDTNGVRKTLVGWYNTQGAGTQLLKISVSSDYGSTWTDLCSSTGWARHIHLIKQDPYTGRIWIGLGDTTAQCGIVSWDGVSAWPAANFDWATLAATSGFEAIYGRPMIRPLCFLFDAKYVYWGADVDTNLPNDAQGIWKMPKSGFASLSPAQVDNSIKQVTATQHGFGLQTSTGEFLICDLQSANTAPNNNSMWTSRDANTWARAHCTTFLNSLVAGTRVGVYVQQIFEWNGAVYISSSGVFAGPWTQMTVALKADGNFDGIEPEPIAPCYWFDFANGTDSGAAAPNSMQYGYTPDYPVKTMYYAWQGTTYWTYGTRIILKAGVHTTRGLFPMGWTSYSLPAAAGEPVYVTPEYGHSRADTEVKFTNAAAYGWYADNANTPCVVRNIYTHSDQSTSSVITGSGAASNRMDFERCIIGNASEAKQINPAGSKIRFRNCYIISGGGTAININSTAIAPEFYGCVIYGGASACISGRTVGIGAYFYNCLVFGQTTRGLQNTNNIPFSVVNSIIWEPSLVAITHNAGTTYGADTFNSNVISGSLTNCTNASTTAFNSFVLAALPYVDATNGNFTVNDSAIDEKGLWGRCSVTFDFSGNRFNMKPSVGPVEYFPPLLRRTIS